MSEWMNEWMKEMKEWMKVFNFKQLNFPPNFENEWFFRPLTNKKFEFHLNFIEQKHSFIRYKHSFNFKDFSK